MAASAAVPARAHRRRAGSRPPSGRRPGCCSATSRTSWRRAGADRPRRPAAHQRRTRPGRLLRAARDHRRHAGGELQPRHAHAHRSGGVTATVDLALDAARAGVMFARAREARDFRRVARRELRRREGGGRVHHPGRQAVRDRAVRARQPALPALQLHDGDAAGQNMAGKATFARAVDPRDAPEHRSTCLGQHRHRQEAFRDQHAAHPRSPRRRRSGDQERGASSA